MAALLDALGPDEATGANAAARPDRPDGGIDDGAATRLTEEIGADAVAELLVLFEAETRGRLAAIAAGGMDPPDLIREVHSA